MASYQYSYVMKDLSKTFPGGKEILKGVTLSFLPDAKIGVLGVNGAGKSTLMKMMAGREEPSNGEAWAADGVRVGYLEQEPHLDPSKTVAENITYGVPAVTTDAVVRAAKTANAHSFVTGFPEQYQTMVGERGVQLSGGQRQRIAIARAILKDPDLLILDEATSALDSTSEREVQAALDALMEGRSSVVIAHRLSTVKNASRICVMEDGRVVEEGRHEELMGRGGHYAQLVKNQELAG